MAEDCKKVTKLARSCFELQTHTYKPPVYRCCTLAARQKSVLFDWPSLGCDHAENRVGENDFEPMDYGSDSDLRVQAPTVGKKRMRGVSKNRNKFRVKTCDPETGKKTLTLFATSAEAVYRSCTNPTTHCLLKGTQEFDGACLSRGMEKVALFLHALAQLQHVFAHERAAAIGLVLQRVHLGPKRQHRHP